MNTMNTLFSLVRTLWGAICRDFHSGHFASEVLYRTPDGRFYYPSQNANIAKS